VNSGREAQDVRSSTMIRISWRMVTSLLVVMGVLCSKSDMGLLCQ
jgi:hypothetical protein